MLTKKECYAYIITILEALYDFKKSALGGIPNGHIYAAVMGKLSLDEYNMLIGICKDSNLLTEENFLFQITPKGAALTEELRAKLTQGKATS